MKNLKKLISMLLLFTIMMNLFRTPVPAASVRKCYTISSSNTRVYSNTGLTRGSGWIYGSDEVTVLDIHDKYSWVKYPVSRGGTKKGYIATKDILTAVSGNNYKAGARITTYRRPGGASYGYIDRNDTVMVLGKTGNYTQVKYPVSGGYKYAFITTGNAEKYLTGSGNNGNGSSYASISDGTYIVRSALDQNKVMDANGSRPVSDETNIQIYSHQGGENQKFTITHVGLGWYKIICNWGNKSLDVHKGKKGNEVNVELYGWHGGGDNQLWRFISAGNGYYYIQSKLGTYLDVWNNQTADETNIQTYEFNGGNNQKWKLDNAGGGNTQATDAARLVAVAKSQLGKQERRAESDDIEYNDWFYGHHVDNSSGFYPWCATFVSWCAEQAGILDTVIPREENTTNMKNGLIQRGGVQHLKNSGYQPVHGDIIFFGSNASQHVGIVDYSSGNTVYYIDGNNTSMWPHGVHNSSCSLNAYNLWGFVTPAYGK